MIGPEPRPVPVVTYRAENGIAWIVLNRPDRGNAWTNQLDDECRTALNAAAADPQVRVVVITGAGTKFCVGADMELLDTLTKDPDSPDGIGGRLQPLTDPRTVAKPVIAAINGSAAGIGLALALMSDIRIASTAARFTTAYAQRGLVAEHGEAWLLQRVVGLSHAADLLLSGRVFDADHAAGIGLVSQTFAPEGFETGVREYALALASQCSPFSMAAIKRQLLADTVGSLDESLPRASALIERSLVQPDLAEGVESFVERRPASFPPLDLHELETP